MHAQVLLVVLICHYTFFVAYCAEVAAMVPLVAFGSNDLGGEFSQSDSLLTHVLGGIIVAEPCICWESGCDVWTLVSVTHSFSHAKILTVLVMLHVALCCYLADIGCVVLVTLSTCFCFFYNFER